MVNPYAQIITFTNATTGATTVQRGISVNTSPVVAGASVLAVVGTAGDAAAGGMIIGEYPEGLITQPANALGAKRIVFYTGSREQSITSEGAGIYDLLPDGAQLFLNAVNYTLTTDLAPLCTVPLVGATNLVAGDAWTFSAGPIGSPPLTYQWYKDGQALPEATEPALAFTSLVPADAGAYQLIVANSLGSATSTVARLEFAVFPAANITNSIITYWPLNEVVGNKTVDLVSGYDMTLVNMGQTNIVPGKWGNAFQFDNASQTILQRINNPGEDLPIYAKLNFSVSLWVNGPVQTDHRVFSEGSTVQNNALFNIGTHNGGADGSVDSYIRTDAGATSGDHRHSTGIAFDST